MLQAKLYVKLYALTSLELHHNIIGFNNISTAHLYTIIRETIHGI